MNESTIDFLDSLEYLEYPKFNITFIEKIQKIYENFKQYDTENLTLEIVKNIFDMIENVIYQKKLYSFFKTYPKIRSNINFVNNKSKLSEVGAFCETIRYSKNHVEYDKYDLGFIIELDALNIKTPKIYYSGGYITRSRVIFIILMLVHESLHLIEYKDTYLCDGKSCHSIFFYKYAYLLFGIISRLSEIFNNNQRKLLVFNTTEREDQLRFSIPIDIQKYCNAEVLLNDYSHYKEKGKERLLGYLTYDMFIDNNKHIYLEDIIA